MKCTICDQKAALHLEHHNLALCSDHFPEWMCKQTERTIQKYSMFRRDEKLLLAVSGGKDSLSLWDILWKLGYHADGIYLDLGIDQGTRYSCTSGEMAQAFAAQRGLNLTVLDIRAKYGESIPEMGARTKRGHQKPCSQCGLVKRYLLNKAALDGGYDAILTAHNLDDEAAFLFSNLTHWSMQYLGRQHPLLPATTGFARKAKPFCLLYERETTAYAYLNNIVYVYSECPYATGSKQLRNKTYLNRLEDEQIGFKYQFYTGYLRALEAGAFPAGQETPEVLEQYRCTNCGQPTLSDGLCTFCRLVKKN
jgi:uncharacterized protein (TIGR00269 family)